MATQREKNRMLIHAFVIMPDHIHLLVTPASDVSLEKAVQFLKGGFSFQLKSKVDVWQTSFNQTRVKDTFAYDACVQYIEQNPVRARMTHAASEYPWSSAARPHEADARPAWFCG